MLCRIVAPVGIEHADGRSERLSPHRCTEVDTPLCTDMGGLDLCEGHEGIDGYDLRKPIGIIGINPGMLEHLPTQLRIIPGRRLKHIDGLVGRDDRTVGLEGLTVNVEFHPRFGQDVEPPVRSGPVRCSNVVLTRVGVVVDALEARHPWEAAPTAYVVEDDHLLGAHLLGKLRYESIHPRHDGVGSRRCCIRHLETNLTGSPHPMSIDG